MSSRPGPHRLPEPPTATTSAWRAARVLHLARETAWAPVGVLLLHGLAGWRFGHEPVVDPIAHFLGGAAVALFFRRAAVVGMDELGPLRPPALDLLAFGLASFAAVVWELGEGLSDLALGSHIQFSAANTLRDLALGIAGATTWILLRRWWRAEKG